MSDHSEQSHSRGYQRAKQSMQCSQSVWMARWTQTSCSDAPHVQNGISLSLMTKGDGDAKKFIEVTDTRTIRIMNESKALPGMLDCQPFPMFNVHQNAVSGIDSKNVLENLPHGQVLRPQFDFKAVRKCNSVLEMASHGSGSREHVLLPERISQCLEEPATQMILYGSNRGKAPQLSVMGRQEKVKQISLGPASKENLSNNCIIRTKNESNPDLGNFSILSRDKYRDVNSAYKKFENSIVRQSNTSLPLHDSSAGSNLLPFFVGESSKKMQNIPHTETFTNHITLLKEKETVNLTNGGRPFQRMPGSMHDTETMGTFTANSADKLSGNLVNFSQTTQNMLFVKNTDINKSKQKEGIQVSGNSMKSNRNMFSQLLSLSQPLCLGQKGVKLQLLGSSSGSQGKGDVREILNPDVCQRNESLAETAIMDMETFRKQNSPSGVNSATSNKKFSGSHDPPSQATTVSVRKIVERQVSTIALPDMNEIPGFQASSSSMDNAEPSTSRTQSLDAQSLHFHSEQPINQNTSQFPKSPPTLQPTTTLEPGSRWLKRLKLSVPHSFGIGTKSSNVGEALSHQKVNKLFSKVVGGNRTSIPDQAFYRFDGKEDNVSNQSAILLQNPSKKDLDILLSHSWIKRWCRGATQKKRVETVVLCDPQCTKLDFDELQNKQFPSIGAMAMMGKSRKAMTGFQPCEFRKRGSLVVWDTKGL